MKCAFYRPEEINVEEFNNIVNGLKKDLAAMESGPPASPIRAFWL